MGMAYGISSGVQTLGERALFYLRLGTRPENVEALRGKWRGFFEPSVLDDLDNLAFEKAVNKYLGRMMFRRLSSINQAFYLSRSLYIHSDPLHSRSFLDKMAELKLSDVQKVAQKYLKIERPTEVIVRARD
jgi:predicted Zn-dependent peptidase